MEEGLENQTVWIAVGADKAQDNEAFVEGMHQSRTWRRAQRAPRSDRRAHHAACGPRDHPRERRRIEEMFGWLKTVVLMRKVLQPDKDLRLN